MLELNHDAPDEKRKHLIHVGKTWGKHGTFGWSVQTVCISFGPNWEGVQVILAPASLSLHNAI